MARWVKAEGRNAYTDLDQQFPFEKRLEWFEKMYIYSCWLRSKNCGILTEPDFLMYCGVLERNWEKLSPRLKSLTSNTRLPDASPVIAKLLTKEEIRGAVEWKLRVLDYRQGTLYDRNASGPVQEP